MKYLKLIFMSLIFLPLCLFAQDVVTDVVVSNEDFIKLLIESIGGVKGASTLAIVGIVVQLVMAFFNTKFGGNLVKGSVKLLIVTGLTLVGGVIGLMVSGGLDIGAALIHSTTLSALMVFVNQLIKQFKKED